MHVLQHLVDVKRISLEENRISKLPKNFFNVFLHVVNMKLYKNRLTSLPSDLGILKHLQLLILNDNNLQVLLLLPLALYVMHARKSLQSFFTHAQRVAYTPSHTLAHTHSN